MENFKNLFLRTLVSEIGHADDHNVLLRTPVTRGKIPIDIFNPNNLVLPVSLVSFYQECSNLSVLWEIYDSDDNTKQFKEHPYLVNTYLNNEYSWSFVKEEMLSGYINITSASDIFNPDFCSNQSYYYRLDYNKKLGNKDEFFPFDINNKVTACLKKTGNEIIDNIWLINVEGEAIYDMNITIEEYLNLAYQAKCLKGWQYVYLLKNKCESYQIMKQILPLIMPNVTFDLSKFGI